MPLNIDELQYDQEHPDRLTAEEAQEIKEAYGLSEGDYVRVQYPQGGWVKGWVTWKVPEKDDLLEMDLVMLKYDEDPNSGYDPDDLDSIQISWCTREEIQKEWPK